jgi:hypothetical protein
VITVTLRGLWGSEERTFTTDDAEDGLVVSVNGVDVVGLDLMYSGLFVGGPPSEGEEADLPEDPNDPTNRPKIIVGCWPDGEQWVRVHEVPLKEEA